MYADVASPVEFEYTIVLPVVKLPPMLFTSLARSKRTRTFLIGALRAPRNSARIAAWLLVLAVFTETTLGFAEIVGARTKVYSCAVILNGGDAVLCRAVIEGEVVTVSDEEYRGCEGI